MDEMDFIQELVLERQAAAIAGIRERMLLEQSMAPPEARDCDTCGLVIPAARLKARPTARMCVDCQTESERLRR